VRSGLNQAAVPALAAEGMITSFSAHKESGKRNGNRKFADTLLTGKYDGMGQPAGKHGIRQYINNGCITDKIIQFQNIQLKITPA
jgi:hypothetical protein